MKLTRLIQEIYFEPSLITPGAHASIRRLIETRIFSADPQAKRDGTGMCGEAVTLEQMQIIDGIAHIPIGGAIGLRLDGMAKGTGAVDVMDISAEIDQASADPNVRAILFDIDSPGGMVSGTPELADKIAALDKPAYVFSNGLVASAAYWLASAADGIFATKTANIGSIGVYIPWLDQTEAFKMEGLSVEIIKAGKLKGMGYPGTSLTDDQRAHLQDRVNEIYDMFKTQVTSTRKGVSKDTMQGQTFMAAQALERGLIDAIVADKSEVVRMI